MWAVDSKLTITETGLLEFFWTWMVKTMRGTRWKNSATLIRVRPVAQRDFGDENDHLVHRRPYL
jgi:hypothetical protein